MDFTADHIAGMLPQVCRSFEEYNQGFAASWGTDQVTAAAKEELCKVFGTQSSTCSIEFVCSGTAANALALSCLAPPYSTVLCARGAHIQTSECNSPEFYSGAKLTLLDQYPDGRIKIDALKKFMLKAHKFPHESVVKAVSITQPTESGMLYTKEEIVEICNVAHQNGLKVHLDGARIANAVVEMGDLSSITWKAGVDCVSFGTTKNGTMCCEALIFFSKEMERELRYRIKRGGHLVEKSRFISCQLLGYLKDDAWIQAARHANKLAKEFALKFSTIEGCSLVGKVYTNLVFVEMRRSMFEFLLTEGFKLSLSAGSQEAKGVPSNSESVRLRICFSWSHTDENVSSFLDKMKAFPRS